MRPVRLFIIALLTGSAFSAALPRKWEDATHSRNAVPDYARVFSQDQVKRLDLQVTQADWDRVVADMTDMAGRPASGNNPGQPGGGGGMPPQQGGANAESIAACVGKIEGEMCLAGNPPADGRCAQLPMGGGLACFVIRGGAGQQPGGQQPGGAAGRDDVELLPRTPIYIPATVTFEGISFEHAGLRLKGNSSLLNSWRSGVDKLPMRLNFDQFEGEFPEIRDQTFFGFPNLNLTNNSQDTSFLRVKIVGDLFREIGVPTPQTAFVRLYLDRGSGPVYLGLYTLVEIPDRPMLRKFFGSDDGNLYKPAGAGGRWTLFDRESFPKKTNAEDEDWTDVEDAIAVLNESRSDTTRWRARFQARFDVNEFLLWLATNTVIGNTDTYGSFSPHNYYVYGSPRHRDRLFWIPWDHDLAMRSNAVGGGGPTTGSLDLFHNTVNSSWPLIRYLLDDPVYRSIYRQKVEQVISTVFEPEALTARLRTEYTRIAPYVVGPEGERDGHTFLANAAQFDDSVFGASGLVAYVQSRVDAVRRALAEAQ
jgi:spore coat protein CotH